MLFSTYQVCVLCFLSTSWLIYQISCFFCGQIHGASVLSMVLTCGTLFVMSIITPWHNMLSESSIRVFWNRHDAMWFVVRLTTSHPRFCLHHQGFCLDIPRIWTKQALLQRQEIHQTTRGRISENWVFWALVREPELSQFTKIVFLFSVW
jgi:hypothetical protein